MPDIEILLYSPVDMGHFITFCKGGTPNSSGGFETDDEEREIRGVISWLNGRQPPQVRFFHTPINHPMKLFMALIQRNPKDPEMPWTGNIAGIEQLLRIDGLIGTISQFEDIGNLLKDVVPNDELDQQYKDARDGLQKVLALIEEDPTRLPFGEAEILAALRSEKASEPSRLFREIKLAFDIQL